MASRTPSTAIDAEAADWVVRLTKTPLDAQARHEFGRWLAQSPEHRRAFELAQWAWTAMGRVAPTTPVARDARTRRVRRRQLPLALAASLLFGIGAIAAYRAVPWIALGADHYTQVGEIRRVELPDGSVVTLDTYSAIGVEYSSDARRIRLLAGAAKFDVASIEDPSSRPFTIAMPGGGTARALGTSFIVALERDGATVDVIEHSVAVTVESAEHRNSRVVYEGQRLRYDTTGKLTHLDDIDLAKSAAWQHGHLMFNDVPLRDALAQINRYRKTPIVVANATLAERKISGMFHLDQLDRAAPLIAAELDAHVTTLPLLLTFLY